MSTSRLSASSSEAPASQEAIPASEAAPIAAPARRALLATPVLAAALFSTGAAAAHASSPGECRYALKSLRSPNLGTTTLRPGSRGTPVRSLQNLLNHAPKLKSSSGTWYRPCPLAEDGVFGRGTESRVRDGQRALGLTVDGVAARLLAGPRSMPTTSESDDQWRQAG